MKIMSLTLAALMFTVGTTAAFAQAPSATPCHLGASQSTVNGKLADSRGYFGLFGPEPDGPVIILKNIGGPMTQRACQNEAAREARYEAAQASRR